MRACLDGTNPVTLLTGARWGRYALQALAVDGAHVLFTANNGVYALPR